MVGLLKQQSEAREPGCLASRTTQADWEWCFKPWGTTAWTVEAKCILAFVRRIDRRVVGEEERSFEKVSRRQKRLQHRTGRVTVSFQLNVFEVQRLVAQC